MDSMWGDGYFPIALHGLILLFPAGAAELVNAANFSDHFHAHCSRRVYNRALRKGGTKMLNVLRRLLWQEDEGQDIAEYAVMLAVILVLVVGTVRLIGTQSNTVFSNVASSIQ